MARVALQVVKKPSFFEERVSFFRGSHSSGSTHTSKAYVSSDRPGDAHSLHYSIGYPDGFVPEVPEYFLERYSDKGDVVLDPFCGGGTTLLAANLSGRVAYGSDQNPLALAIAESKVSPSDITEVTLGLQAIDLKQPVNIKMYSEYFAPFYDLETFRELYNLKNHFARNRDRVSRFMRLMSLSLLHGSGAGAFSVHTRSMQSLSPHDQDELNIKRRQIPDYRAVLPRILKKTASVLRDGYPSLAEGAASKNKFSLCDARNLGYVPTSGVDLVITAPPLPHLKTSLTGQWLKLWFLGEQVSNVEKKLLSRISQRSWRDFMNEFLLELARVVRPGGRAVLDLGAQDYDEDIIDIVSQILGKYWTAECVLYSEPVNGKKAVNCIVGKKSEEYNKYLVLRRW